MLPSFADESVTLVDPVWTTDARNSRRPDYGPAAARRVVPGCSVQPGATAEILAGRDTTTVRFTVLAPAGTVVEPTTGCEYEGRLYRVDGQPARWKSPTGSLDHVVLLLVDWK